MHKYTYLRAIYTYICSLKSDLYIYTYLRVIYT